MMKRPVLLLKVGSKFSMISCLSTQGDTSSYLRPRFNVSRELNFQSSWKKYPCSQSWASMIGRALGMKVTVVAGSPKRKFANGLTPLPVYFIEPRGLPLPATNPSWPTLRTKSAPILKLCLFNTQVRVSPNVARYWLVWRSVLRSALRPKVTKLDPRLMKGCPCVESCDLPTTAA